MKEADSKQDKQRLERNITILLQARIEERYLGLGSQ